MAAPSLPTTWPLGSQAKPLVCVRVQIKASELFHVMFGSSELQEQLHKQRGDMELVESPWVASKDELPTGQYTWAAPEGHGDGPSNTLRFRKVRFKSPPAALATVPFNNEEIQSVTEYAPNHHYCVEACSTTSAPYGTNFNVYFKYSVRAESKSSSTLHITFHVEFFPTMNRMLKPMVGKAIENGVRGTFKILRNVLATLQPSTQDIPEAELGDHGAHHDEADHAHPHEAPAPGVPSRPPEPMHVPSSSLPWLSTFTETIVHKDQVTLLSDLVGVGLRSVTANAAAAQVLAVALTVWLISLAVSLLRSYQVFCSGSSHLLLTVCWPLRLLDLPQSTSEVLASLALVAGINWAVIACSQLCVQHLQQMQPGAAAATASHGGDALGLPPPRTASFGSGPQASLVSVTGAGLPALAAVKSGMLVTSQASPRAGSKSSSGAGTGDKDKDKGAKGKALRAAPPPKPFPATQLAQLELGQLSKIQPSASTAKRDKSPQPAAAAAAPSKSMRKTGSVTSLAGPPSEASSTAAASRGRSSSPAPSAKVAPAPAAMADAWAAELPAGLVSDPATDYTAAAVLLGQAVGSPDRPAPPLGGSPTMSASAGPASLASAAPASGAADADGQQSVPPERAMPPGVTRSAGPTLVEPGMHKVSAGGVGSTSGFANMFTKEGLDSMTETFKSAFRWDTKPADHDGALGPEHSPLSGRGRPNPAAVTSPASMSMTRVDGPRGMMPTSYSDATSHTPLLNEGSLDGEAYVVVEEVFENERFQPFRGWGHMWPGHFLPSDRVGHWSDRQGKPGGSASMTFELVEPQLPHGWKWLEQQWEVDMDGVDVDAVDAEGWTYALDFYLLKYPPPPGSGKCSIKHFVRRRRYVRTRVRILPPDQEMELQRTSNEASGSEVGSMAGTSIAAAGMSSPTGAAAEAAKALASPLISQAGDGMLASTTPGSAALAPLPGMSSGPVFAGMEGSGGRMPAEALTRSNTAPLAVPHPTSAGGSGTSSSAPSSSPAVGPNSLSGAVERNQGGGISTSLPGLSVLMPGVATVSDGGATELKGADFVLSPKEEMKGNDPLGALLDSAMSAGDHGAGAEGTSPAPAPAGAPAATATAAVPVPTPHADAPAAEPLATVATSDDSACASASAPPGEGAGASAPPAAVAAVTDADPSIDTWSWSAYNNNSPSLDAWHTPPTSKDSQAGPKKVASSSALPRLPEGDPVAPARPKDD